MASKSDNDTSGPNDQKTDDEGRSPSAIEAASKEKSSDEPYSVWTNNQKKLLVLGASLAAFLSPMSGAIYLPALVTIAADEHVTTTLINLTVTTYLIFQGLAPTFVGGFSDTAGRRPAFIICFVIYLVANIGLALQNSYAALIVLRCVQSAGSSGTVALANAVAADIVTSAERGSYIGYASVPSILAPSLSPVIGGLLSSYAGWRWIFWFCLIFAVVVFIPFLTFFPETCRKIVGNGSIPAAGFHQSLPGYLRERRLRKQGQLTDAYAERDRLAKERHLRFPNPVATLVIIFNKQAGLILICNALLFAAFYAISVSLASQFSTKYGFNDAEIGLMYLPLGAGSLISAFTTGKLLDANYRRHAKRLGMPLQKSKQDDLSHFPIETARLQIALPLMIVGSMALITYGWAVQFTVHLAVPCIAIFVFGYAMIAGFNALNILMVDTYPGKPATATAANNLVRCWLGAGASAGVGPLIGVIGVGWTCSLMAFIWLAYLPVLLLLMKKGPQWRREAKRKEAKKEENKSAKAEIEGKAKNGEAEREVSRERMDESSPTAAVPLAQEKGEVDEREEHDKSRSKEREDDRNTDSKRP